MSDYQTFPERIRAGEFEVEIEYPSKPAKPRLVSNPTAADAWRFAAELDLYEAASANYSETIQRYREAQHDAEDRFKFELLADLGILGHEKADKLFEMAWERSSDGYESVYHTAEELSELLS